MDEEPGDPNDPKPSTSNLNKKQKASKGIVKTEPKTEPNELEPV